MKVKINGESGYYSAMLGLSLSYNQPEEKMYEVAKKLALKGGGHNKFLESIVVWIDITASRQFWQQFDTYRIGVSKQSESTMHTIMKNGITRDLFEHELYPCIPDMIIGYLEFERRDKNFIAVKNALPESFLQRRIVCTNYMALQRIFQQRRNHKLPEWNFFCDELLKQIQYKEFITCVE